MHERRPWRGTWALVAALGMAGACSGGGSTTLTSPSIISMGSASHIFTIGGDVVAIDDTIPQLYVQGGTVVVRKVTLTSATTLDGDATSLDGIAALTRAGFVVGVKGFTTADSADADQTAISLTITKAGPYPVHLETAFLGIGDFLGVPAFQADSTILQVPPDAALDPASPIASLDDARIRIRSGQAVCVSADTLEIATANYRAMRYAMRPSTSAPVCSG